MKMKKKLKYLTPEEFYNWEKENCNHTECNACPFKSANCNLYDEDSWVNHKELFSDKFLNQELEINTLDILDEKEKQYLQNVIKPFKDRVKSIAKQNDTDSYEYISIGVSYPINKRNGCDTDYIWLPSFESGTMYRNIELDKKYTLEELGL